MHKILFQQILNITVYNPTFRDGLKNRGHICFGGVF